MCTSGYFLSYVDGLGTSYARSVLAYTHARFYKELDREMSNKRRFYEKFTLDCLGSQKYIKNKVPCIFQATKEVMSFSWSLIKRQKPFLCNTCILNSNKCTCTAKS